MQIDVARLAEAIKGQRNLKVLRSNGKVGRFEAAYYMQNQTVPNAGTMRSLCEQTGVSADWLLGRSEKKEHGEIATRAVPNLYKMVVLLDPFSKDVDRAQRMFGEKAKPNSAMSHFKRMCRSNRCDYLHMDTVAMVADGYGLSLDFVLGIGGTVKAKLIRTEAGA